MKLHIENSIVIEMNGKTTTLGCGKYEFDSASEFIEFIESLGDESKQPLIKDEKIRKAIRAWAEALDLRWFRRCSSVNAYTSRLTGHDAEGVCYTMELKPKDLYGDKITKDSYTLAELCGEEEE